MISGGTINNPAAKTDKFIQPGNAGIRDKGKIAGQINNGTPASESAMQNERAKHNKISAHSAARTDPMITGKKEINNTINAGFPSQGKASGTDDGPYRHNNTSSIF
jgi:hypothetical protein